MLTCASGTLYDAADAVHVYVPPTSLLPLSPTPQDELGSPALAFVRLLVHLLSLDKSLETEVRLLGRGLLRLVGVDEFSPSAKWVDPCISFRLHDVICRCAGRARGDRKYFSQVCMGVVMLLVCCEVQVTYASWLDWFAASY
jgi:hypothetical protein